MPIRASLAMAVPPGGLFFIALAQRTLDGRKGLLFLFWI